MSPRIVLASRLSESESHTARVAARLADQLGADLVVVYVAAELETAAQLQAAAGTDPEDAAEQMRAEIGRAMGDFVRRHLGERPVRARVLEGEVAEEVARAAEAEGAEYLVIGTEGRTGLRRVVLGSTSEAIIHLATCPVVVVPPPRRHEE